MLAYILNQHNAPLMPCHPGKARILLKEKKAKVVQSKPFTIQLLYGSAGYKQAVNLGIDSGYQHIGISANTEEKEVLQAEIELRDDIVKLNAERKEYRRTRRNRNTWYRASRFLNRKKGSTWLAPSIQHKLDSHIRIIEAIEKILPISKIVVEVGAFDIQKIKNPEITGAEYQNGEQKDFWNTREYMLSHRSISTPMLTQTVRATFIAYGFPLLTYCKPPLTSEVVWQVPLLRAFVESMNSKTFDHDHFAPCLFK